MSDFEQALAFGLHPLHRALCAIANVLAHGSQKHPRDDGFKQTVEFHIDRAEKHLVALRGGDRTEPHLEHAATRLLMAVEASRR